MSGRLVVVGTPIGNLGDMSPRAAEALSTADVVCCEDTRVTRRLLSAANVSAPRLVALHDSNEASVTPKVIGWLHEGKTVALTSDAGMPAVADPGQRLVAAAAEAGVEVTVVPGPSAALAGLVLSGLPTDRFTFEGFLPRKGPERRARLAAIAGDERTTVLFESPRRVASSLADLAAACGPDRRCAVGRELTKLHEDVWRGTLAQAHERTPEEPRGEHVIVVEGAPKPADATDDQIVAALAARMNEGMDRKSAIAEVATALNAPKRRVYDLALATR